MEKLKNSLDLYSSKILALAGDIPLMDRLPQPDSSVTKRSRLCGSVVTIDLNVRDGCVSSYAHDVKACALGQASACILARNIIGKTGNEIVQVRHSVIEMLNGSRYSHHLFTDYHILSPASQFKNRHESILLCLDATIIAIKNVPLKSATSTLDMEIQTGNL